MTAAIIISALAMTAIVAVRYLISSGLFAALTARRFPGRLAGQRRQILRELGWSLASAAIYGIPAGVVAWGWQQRGWTRIYTGISDYPLWWLPLSVVIYLLLHDTWFYWTHRLMHRPWWFKQMHAVHHASRPPTAWAAMSFHPWEAITGAVVIPVLVFIVPIHVAMLGLVLTIMTIMGVTNHMGWEMFPRRLVHGPLGTWMITASHHELHHQKYRCNYGLYFRFWDHLCGTDKGLGQFAPARTRGLGHGDAGPRRSARVG
ncbi:sterol desaturase family protein [Sphingomonas edaphi]|uniref:Fatty acid hydroxylase family protein n=1 Tax=Sphingomonas edaphi TaxID=2315689 RepID=A0A418PZH7_9SPHN|nr:sterol desaturase family protein [Sphingomonas edaphi]RIX29231.1 fatty acid hydroxylase family protein [Sphingomonas edaphi]